MRKIVLRASLGFLCIASVAALGQGFRGFRILGDAPLDKSVVFPKERLAELFREMEAGNNTTTRMLEGGKFNVNIRHLANVTPDKYTTLVHPDTIDVWVVQEGSGTMVTGGERIDNTHHTGGEERSIKVGDLVYIPAGMPHGMKETSSITFLNIRFPEDRN